MAQQFSGTVWWYSWKAQVRSQAEKECSHSFYGRLRRIAQHLKW